MAESVVQDESRPDAKVSWVYRRLIEAYGTPERRPSGDPLGELIATILSQHTSDVNSHRAYQHLLTTFPTWETVRDAPTGAVADAIRPGGLATLKAARIQQVLRELTERVGGQTLHLNMLATLPLEEAEAYLRSLPGVGPKTAACVLLFGLGLPAFPVDTHVWRLARRLGLIGARTSAEAAHGELARMVALEWRHTLHINMIRLGRQICHAQHPLCERCVLRAHCDYYWQSVNAHSPR